MKTRLIYSGKHCNEISFPIGGIGTGCIGLGGDGRLREWEIFNAPNKGGVNGFSHLAVRAEKDGKVLDARVLNSDLPKPYSGQLGDFRFRGFGHGPFRETMAGLPHFEEAVFEGAFPFAHLRFKDARFPGKAVLTAFNPFIPLNDHDSGLPAAFFEVTMENTTPEALDYTVAFSVGNPFPQGDGRCEVLPDTDITALRLFSASLPETDIRYGDLTFATDEKNTSIQQYWFRGQWFDNLAVFWRDFMMAGPLRNRVYDSITEGADGTCDTATIASHFHLESGEKHTARFAVCWYYPNASSYEVKKRSDGTGNDRWKNYYATCFSDSRDVCQYVMREWNRLRKESKAFSDIFFSQTLPKEAIDAISANISILKSPTCLRLEDGTFYGWEGCHAHSGSCEGSCTHVWNYAYALPFLFPKLERSMREADYRYNQDEFGGMQFRLVLPLGSPRDHFRPCCDGQFGGVIKTYRDWKICGDDEWLRSIWPMVKNSLEYAWSPDNPDKWDLDADGVLEGRQHHTLDMELFGPNSWLTSMYLAALKAGAEIAAYLGEKESAMKYTDLLKRGAAYVNEEMFNGEYFYQKIDLEDKSILAPYENSAVKSLKGHSVYQAYWNDEANELKYQIGEGCMIDQILGQWHADMCGLGDILDPEKVGIALHSVYRYNHKKDLRLHVNPCRMYFMADEAATLECEWPEGKRKPVVAVPYAEESFHGTEYQAAAHMIHRGMPEEGLEIVRAVRDRYDGERRNPWNEIECGSNYARSMASYALLLAFSGFGYDMNQNYIAFRPVEKREKYNFFWSLDSGWGRFVQDGSVGRIMAAAGKLKVSRIGLSACPKAISINGKDVDFRWENDTAVLSAPVTITADQPLLLKW